MQVYINCLNNFLIEGKKAIVRVKSRVGLKVKIWQIGAKMLLLLVKAFGERLSNLLLAKFIDKEI